MKIFHSEDETGDALSVAVNMSSDNTNVHTCSAHLSIRKPLLHCREEVGVIFSVMVQLCFICCAHSVWQGSPLCAWRGNAGKTQ